MSPDPSCVFCRILAGELPGSFVFRDERVAAFMALPQARPGLVLVVPVQHVRDLYELPDELAGPLLGTAARIARAVKRALQPEGISLLQNNEPAAGQTVFHLHIHVLPRAFGRRLEIHPPDAVSDRAVLDDLAAQVRSALAG